MKYHVYNKEMKKLKDKLWQCKLDKKYMKIVFTVNSESDSLTENNIVNYGCIPVDKTGKTIFEPKKYKDRIKNDSNQPCYKLTLDFKKAPQIIVGVVNQDLKYFEDSDTEFGISWTSLSNEHKELRFIVVQIDKSEY